MKRIIIAACLALAGCAGSVELKVDQGVVVTEMAFKTAQQLALAGIQSGVIAGATKDQVIALNDKGQAIEDQIVAGRDVALNVAALAAVVQQLSQLGVK